MIPGKNLFFRLRLYAAGFFCDEEAAKPLTIKGRKEKGRSRRFIVIHQMLCLCVIPNEAVSSRAQPGNLPRQSPGRQTDPSTLVSLSFHFGRDSGYVAGKSILACVVHFLKKTRKTSYFVCVTGLPEKRKKPNFVCFRFRWIYLNIQDNT